MKKAYITGITGQDGSYLAEFLLEKGYEVHGLVRKTSGDSNLGNIKHILPKLKLHIGSLASYDALMSHLKLIQPDEIYHLAAQSHVKVSYDIPTETMETNAVGTVMLLEAMRVASPKSKLYNASTSEMFGLGEVFNEESPFKPISIYSAAKVAAHHSVQHYRRAFNLFTVNGILGNHESPRRGENFVTRKISMAAARIAVDTKANRKSEPLYLGNLDTSRDWGFAGEYVIAMWKMLQEDVPRDYILGTNKATSLRQFLSYCFESLWLDWEDHVQIDPNLMRPVDQPTIRIDGTKSQEILNWTPEVQVEELAIMMVDSDLARIRNTQNEDYSKWLKERNYL